MHLLNKAQRQLYLYVKLHIINCNSMAVMWTLKEKQN